MRYVGKPKVGESESSRSSSARSISADEAAREKPETPEEEPDKPDQPTEGDIFISIGVGSIGMIQTGGPAAGAIIGSGNPASKVWDVADFNEVKIGSTFRAEITKGDGFKVTTSSDDNVVEHIRVVKEGKTLKIGLESG